MLASRAGRGLVSAGITPEVGTDLGWAYFNIGSAGLGRVIVDRLAADGMAADLAALKLPSWEVAEVSAMSLAFEDSMTALDLCADAVFLASGAQRRAADRFYDFGTLKKSVQTLATTASVAAWVNAILGDRDLSLLEGCRHALTHRYFRRTFVVALQSGREMTRGLSEITDYSGKSLGSIGVLIPRIVGFAEMQFESLCLAFLADFPAA
jgi:hypothetical protein